MVLFAVPTGVALAHRVPPRRDPYPHLSTWQLVREEIVDELRRMWTTTTRRCRRREGNGHREDARRLIDDWAAEHGLMRTTAPPAGRVPTCR